MLSELLLFPYRGYILGILLVLCLYITALFRLWDFCLCTFVLLLNLHLSIPPFTTTVLLLGFPSPRSILGQRFISETLEFLCILIIWLNGSIHLKNWPCIITPVHFIYMVKTMNHVYLYN